MCLLAHPKYLVTPRPCLQRHLGCLASQGLFDRGCACWRRGVPSREGPRLGLLCYSNEVSRQWQSPGAKWELRGKKPSPSVRRAVAPAGERTCGPAPAPCFLFIRHRRNDLKVLVAERFAGKLPSKQPRSAEACGGEGAASHWCGPATLEAGPGQGAPERPTGKIFIEETDGGVHLGGWRKTMNLHLPGHWCRTWDAHVRRENIVARTLSSPANLPPAPPAPLPQAFSVEGFWKRRLGSRIQFTLPCGLRLGRSNRDKLQGVLLGQQF